MNKKQLASAVFLSGKIVEKNAYVFSSRLDSLPDGEYHHARISGYREGDFVFQDRNMQVVSVCIRRETREEPLRSTCLLPRFHSVVGFYQKGGDQYDEILPPPPNEVGGIMKQLRLIDGRLYAVGSGSCIFERTSKNQWRALVKGFDTRDTAYYEQQGRSFSEALALSGKNETNINSICGRNGKIFCAGYRGRIFYLRNDEWLPVESGTNATLYDVQLDHAGVVYVSGKMEPCSKVTRMDLSR